MKRHSAFEYTPADVRKILLELRYFYTAQQLSDKWHITPYRLRQWKRQWNYAYLTGTLRELVIVAVHQGAQTSADVIAYLDYLDHAVYTADEISAVLAQLEAEELVVQRNGHWRYNQLHSANDTSFIF